MWVRFLYFLLLISTYSLLAQDRSSYRWYFGERSGLNFNTTPPTVLTDGRTSSVSNFNEGTSVICDPQSGDLLFYTNGNTIWNKNHQVMAADLHPQTASSTHASLIVRQPGSSRYYHVFTTSGNPTSASGARHIVVDMTLNSGRGNVISNTLLINAIVCEKVIAVGNCSSYWVVICTPQKFYTYRVSAAGLSTTPIISSINSVTIGAVGEMVLSPDKKRIALASWENGGIGIFNFDNQSGIVSLHTFFSINNGYRRPYGMCFSPNNTWLYVSNTDPTAIGRYNLRATDISSSYQNLATPTVAAGQLELAPDGKIYMANYDRYLSSITNPDSQTPVFTDMAFPVTTKSFWGLPSFPYEGAAFTPVPINTDTTICFGTTVRIGTPPQQGYTYLWEPAQLLDNPAQAQPLARVIQTTTFKRTVFSDAGCTWTDSITVHIGSVKAQITSQPLAVSGTINLCEGTMATLSAPEGLSSYQWSTGATTQTISVNTSGTYILSITDMVLGCESADTVIVRINALPVVTVKDLILCQGESGELTIEDYQSNLDYTWSDEKGSILGKGQKLAVSPQVTTKYIIEARSVEGCTQQDTAIVSVEKTRVSLSIIIGDSTLLHPGNTVSIQIQAKANRAIHCNNISYTLRGKASLLRIDNAQYQGNDIVLHVSGAQDVTTTATTIQTLPALVLWASATDRTLQVQIEDIHLSTNIDTACVEIDSTMNIILQMNIQEVCAAKLRAFNLIGALALAPNPVHEELTVQSDLAIEELHLLSSLGEELQDIPLDASDKKNLRLNVCNCAAGLYLLRLRFAGNRTWTTRSVVIVK